MAESNTNINTNESATVKPKKEKMVDIYIPREKDKDKNGDVFVSVNERTWLIKRGVHVEVPECVAEVLRHAEEAEAEAYEFTDSVEH